MKFTICFIALALLGLAAANPLLIRPRITNGALAPPGQFPWHIMFTVQYRNDNTRITYCGGAILNELWMISTADCIENARSVRAVIGTTDLKKPTLTINPQMYVIHPRYNGQFFNNNLALLRLPKDRPLAFPAGPRSAFGPIRLPSLSQRFEKFTQHTAYYTGFGSTVEHNRNITDKLMYADQQIISNEECLTHYGKEQRLISDEVVCAHGRFHGACYGDGGDPLVINEFGEWTLIGLLSFMHGTGSCGRQPVATAFTRITHHYDWIAATTGYHFRP